MERGGFHLGGGSVGLLWEIRVTLIHVVTTKKVCKRTKNLYVVKNLNIISLSFLKCASTI